VFTPIQVMPWYLEIASRIAPLRYAVDFVRGVFYAGTPDYDHVVLQSPSANLEIIVPAFLVCIVVGTFFFVRSERNR
jgi:ABC-2 type transport system permease protein